jgi:hypothetical protein
METLEGRVLLVQEGRFMLETDQGVRRLFILSHDAAVEAQQLPPLQRTQARIRVMFRPAPDMIAGTAHAIECLA